MTLADRELAAWVRENGAGPATFDVVQARAQARARGLAREREARLGRPISSSRRRSLPCRASSSATRRTTLPVIKAETLEGGNLRGADHGASISLILDESEPGGGPRLHRHPYDETWVVQEGRVTFRAGEDRMTAGPGDIVIVPPGVPHKFSNDGPGRSKLVCIHASPTFIGEWLE